MISGASIDRCVRILLTTFYHMHHYTVQLLGRWSSVHIMLYYMYVHCRYTDESMSHHPIHNIIPLNIHEGTCTLASSWSTKFITLSHSSCLQVQKDNYCAWYIYMYMHMYMYMYSYCDTGYTCTARRKIDHN